MEYVINLALGIIGSLVAAEIVLHHKRWCQRIIESAARRIRDTAQGDIKREEWLAALDQHAGVFASFSHAIGCWFGAPAVAAELKSMVPKKVRVRRFKITFRPNSRDDDVKWMLELVEAFAKCIKAVDRIMAFLKGEVWVGSAVALTGIAGIVGWLIKALY